jgi:hypothetical protein
VPVRNAILTVTTVCALAPAGSLHMIEVVEIQLLVVHCVAPIDIDGDASNSAKFMPDNVSVEPPPAGPFASRTNVSAGAAPRPSICPRDQI